MDQCNRVCNLIIPRNRLTKDEHDKHVDTTMYKQIVGCLMYMLATRPDLAYSVSFLARYVERPFEVHLAATRRILRYLKGTMNLNVIQEK